MAKSVFVPLRLMVGLISSIGSLVLIVVVHRSVCRCNRRTVAAIVLLLIATCDFVTSITSVVSNLLSLLPSRSSDWHNVLLLAIHWTSNVVSFFWTLTLALYIIQRISNSRPSSSFNLVKAHVCIWTSASGFFMLRIWSLLLSKVDHHAYDNVLLTIVKAIWCVSALGTLVVVVWALVVFNHRIKAKHIRPALSIVCSRLMLYVVAFLCLVLPNLIKDLLWFVLAEDNEGYNGITSTLLACLPLANSCIYLFKGCGAADGASSSATDSESRSTAMSIYSVEALGISSFVHHQSSLTPAKGENMTDINNLLNSDAKSQVRELVGLEIGPKIGEGVAVVYKGKWRGAEVAVKMQMLSLHAMEEFQDECNDEIQIEAHLMKSLMHPNIVLFMEVGFYHGSICIISEFCSRGSLRDVLKNEQKTNLVSWPMRIRLALGISAGIAYLHNSSPKMIHRDLKSPNILVDETWHAKLGDFGTLRLSEIVYQKDSTLKNHRTSNSTMTGLVGTTRWMAPEVIKGERVYDEKIDIYSLGIILWELIDGKLPFEDIRWNHTIERVILQGKRPVIGKKCPPRWKVLITMCWQHDPLQRPTIRQVLRDLERVASEEIWESILDSVDPAGSDSPTITSDHPTPQNFTRLVSNIQTMDCDYILQNTACAADISEPTKDCPRKPRSEPVTDFDRFNMAADISAPSLDTCTPTSLLYVIEECHTPTNTFSLMEEELDHVTNKSDS